MKKIISSIICLLLCVSCGKGNNPPSGNINTPPVSVSTRVSEYVLEPEGYIANSEAIEINPVEGLTISAEDNSLYEDTSFEVYEYEYDEWIKSVDEYLKNDDIYAYKAYEIDAGLEYDEYLPGSYTVKIDLNTIDVDPILYDTLTAYRIDSEGNIFEYDTSIIDNQLVFESDQNSVVIIGGSITIAGLLIYGYRSERSEIEGYYDLAENARLVKEGKAIGGKYRIIYSPSDMGAQYRMQMKRFTQLSDEIRKQAEKDYEEEYSINNYSMFGFLRNKDKAKFIKERIDSNKELKQLADELSKPKGLQIIEERINWAFSYLTVREKVKMPKHVVDFYISSGLGDLGEEKSGTFKNSYIVLNGDAIGAMVVENRGQQEKDDLLLTITHELFHICEERYHIGAYKLTNNTKFDEALALILEKDAKNYYKENNFIESDPELTQSDHYETMIIPIDKDPSSGDGEKDNDICIRQGYFLSRFIEYLRENVDSSIKVKDILNTRNYLWNTTISSPLMKAFSISEKQFDSLFRNFFMKYRNEYDTRYRKIYPNFDYPQKSILKLVDNGKVQVTINNKDSYHSEIQTFVKDSNNKSVLLVMFDPDIVNKHGEMNIVPLDKYTLINNGCFIGEDVYYGIGDYLNVLEIYGKVDSNASDSYYSVYCLNPLSVPKSEIKGNDLIININDKSKAGEDKILEGYGIKVVCSDGKTSEVYVSYEQASKGISLALDDLCFDKKDKNNVSYEVSYCEYLLDKDGIKLCGPYSAYASGGSDELAWMLDELIYKEYVHYKPSNGEGSEKCIGINGEEVPCVVASQNEMITSASCDDNACKYEACTVYSSGNDCLNFVSDVGDKIYRNTDDLIKFIESQGNNTKNCLLYSDENDTNPDYLMIINGKIAQIDKFNKKVKFELDASFIIEIGGIKRKYKCVALTKANNSTTKHVNS